MTMTQQRVIRQRGDDRQHRVIQVPDSIVASNDAIATAFDHYREMFAGWRESRRAIEEANSAISGALSQDRGRLSEWIRGGSKGSQPKPAAEGEARKALEEAQRLEAAHREAMFAATDELERVVVQETEQTLADIAAAEAHQVAATLQALEAFGASAERLMDLRWSLHWLGRFPDRVAGSAKPLTGGHLPSWPTLKADLRAAIEATPQAAPEPAVVSGEGEDAPDDEEESA